MTNLIKITVADQTINLASIEKTMQILNAIKHDFRIKIMNILHSEKKQNVTDLFVKLRVEQSVASQHLAILRKAGLVITERDAKYIYYSVNYEMLESIFYLIQKVNQKDGN